MARILNHQNLFGQEDESHLDDSTPQSTFSSKKIIKDGKEKEVFDDGNTQIVLPDLTSDDKLD